MCLLNPGTVIAVVTVLTVTTTFPHELHSGDIGSEPAATPESLSTSWPSFRNGNSQRGVAGCDLPDQPEWLWGVPTEHGWVAAAAIVNGRVYAGSLTGWLYCLDLLTGEEIWRYRSIDDPDPKQFAPGFPAAPRVTDESVYIGDEDGVFHAVNRETGIRDWQFSTDAQIAGCAAVVGDQIIVCSYDSHLYSLSPDGALQWKYRTNDRINCSPAVVDSFTFVAGCDEHLRVIDIEKGEQKTDIPMGSFLIGSPAVVDEMLYVGMHNAEVVAVNWKTEEIVWRYSDPDRRFPYHSSAAVTNDHVLLGGQDSRFHCINRHTGERTWVFPTNGRIDSSAAVAAGQVFFGSADGNVYGVNIADGTQTWKYNSGKRFSAGVAIGEECLVIGEEGRNGKLLCFGRPAS